jgi:hypothetical protein
MNKPLKSFKLMWGDKTLEQAAADGDVIIHNLGVTMSDSDEHLPDLDAETIERIKDTK